MSHGFSRQGNAKPDGRALVPVDKKQNPKNFDVLPGKGKGFRSL